LRVLDTLKQRLEDAGSGGQVYTGVLYGLHLDGEVLVVGAAGKEGGGDLELCNEMIPCGIEPIGVFGLGDGEGSEEIEKLASQLPATNQADETLVLLSLSPSGELEGKIVGEDSSVKVGVITGQELANLITLVRVRGYVEVNCGMTQPEVGNAFKHLIEKVSCPYGSFRLEGERLFFLHKFIEKDPGRGWTSTVAQKEEEDCLIAGLEQPDAKVCDLWAWTEVEEESDGFGGSSKKAEVKPRDVLEFQFRWNYTNPACSSRTIGCAPILHREKKSGTTVRIPIVLDALGVIPSSAPATQLMEILKGAVGRQVGDVAAAVISELKMKGSISAPQVFHFLPPGLGHHISLIYSKSATTTSFENFRRSVHTSFLLPLDRPLLRRANRVSFPSPGCSGAKLTNVHRGLETKHGIPGNHVKVALVQGAYDYHHYMQDNFDDDGWGCAYRSLQTIVSWLRLQGYTETEVPDHRQVQKCLVDIGDKESKFIGSKKWIGSTEVGFVLETACGTESRFLSVNSGSELGSRARELVAHFESQGSPVMIGGGVYAHTILGVAWDEDAGEVAWLILDPHYTGKEDVKTIHSKGWCGWKGPKFWNQTAFYNMCLPQRPKCGL